MSNKPVSEMTKEEKIREIERLKDELSELVGPKQKTPRESLIDSFVDAFMYDEESDADWQSDFIRNVLRDGYVGFSQLNDAELLARAVAFRSRINPENDELEDFDKHIAKFQAEMEGR